MTTRIPLYLDCDTGIDDALALLYLLHSPEVEIVGIGTVHGNTDPVRAARNTLDLLQLAGRADIPVAIGAEHALDGEPHAGAPHVHGDNGIGGVELPTATRAPEAEAAHEMLTRLSREHVGTLRVLAIGPLTNLAIALDHDEDLTRRVARVDIMGGAIRVSGNVTAHAEANIHNDARAADLVLRAPWPVVLVPLDVTRQHSFTPAEQDRLLASTDPATVAVGRMLTTYMDFYETVVGDRCCILHDPLAAAVAVDAIQPTSAFRAPLGVTDDGGVEHGRTVVTSDTQGTTSWVASVTAGAAEHLLERLLSPAAG
ncbi:nucleoside hydrolase [Frigoribacterium sp. 2-23]|uniref:nucleoside hydrolase n=1 Tax=Frigoribacterium sp. 2-23 TaxID=3415006 RepID=UPI003C7034D9